MKNEEGIGGGTCRGYRGNLAPSFKAAPWLAEHKQTENWNQYLRHWHKYFQPKKKNTKLADKLKLPHVGGRSVCLEFTYANLLIDFIASPGNSLIVCWFLNKSHRTHTTQHAHTARSTLNCSIFLYSFVVLFFFQIFRFYSLAVLAATCTTWRMENWSRTATG